MRIYILLEKDDRMSTAAKGTLLTQWKRPKENDCVVFTEILHVSFILPF